MYASNGSQKNFTACFLLIFTAYSLFYNIYTLELYTGILCEHMDWILLFLDFTLVLKEVYFHVLVLRSYLHRLYILDFKEVFTIVTLLVLSDIKETWNL